MTDLSTDSWSALLLQSLICEKDTDRNFCLKSKTRKKIQFSYIFLLCKPRKPRERRKITKIFSFKRKLYFF